MNIFFVSADPLIAARSLPDKLVVKMPLETAQLLSTAINELGGNAPYKSTHKNHPSAVWCRQSRANFDWLVTHGLALCAEYSFRYGKTHKCAEVIQICASQAASCVWPSVGATFPPLCMPDQYKHVQKSSMSREEHVTLAYQAYLVGEKQHYAKWTKRERPEWYTLRKDIDGSTRD